MGQTESTEAPQEPQPSPNKHSDHIIKNKISNDILKKNFSNLESYSLLNIFENLSSVKDGIEVIEEEAFIVSIRVYG